jgi:hypothetical protein
MAELSSPYTTGLIENGLGLFTNGLAAFPSAVIVTMMIFMLETLVAIPEAKLYFVLGIILLLIPFYTFGVLCFPANSAKAQGGEPTSQQRECMQMIAPFMTHTSASFYNFMAGYVFGYWANLNLQKQTSNATMSLCYYFAIAFFCFVFSVFYVESCTWKPALVSSSFGIVGGMVWAQMIASKIHTPGADKDAASSSSKLNAPSVAGATKCDGSNTDEMVCNAFR